MIIIDIDHLHPLWSEAWRLYRESFPVHERRSLEAHVSAESDEAFYTQAVVDEGRLVAILFWWLYDGGIFLEHLAVSPTARGQGVGSALLERFIAEHPGRGIILEIDPPVDDTSQRRLRFYERLGFRLNHYPYIHTSYTFGGREHELKILSRPSVLSDGQFADFRKFVCSRVLLYRD